MFQVTLTLMEWFQAWFENDVKTYGTQAASRSVSGK